MYEIILYHTAIAQLFLPAIPILSLSDRGRNSGFYNTGNGQKRLP